MECCGPDFPGASYSRGPTDKNPAMFDFERKMADQMSARYGSASDAQSGMVNNSKIASPGPGQVQG